MTAMLVETPAPSVILGILIPLLVLDITFVFLRFRSRYRLKQKIRADDWITIPSLVLVVACSAIMFYGINSKTLGYRAPVITDLQTHTSMEEMEWRIVTARKLERAFLCIFAPALGLVKLSVLFLYYRIFVITRSLKDLRSVILAALIAIIAAWGLSFTFALVFLCRGHFEPEIYSDAAVSAVQCNNGLDVGYSYAITDFITDVLILLFPIPLIWKLHLPLGQRVAVIGIFFLGMMATIASLIRLIVGVWARKVGYDPSLDEELMLTQEIFWCLLEITIALFATCLPTLRTLFRSFASRLFSYASSLVSRVKLVEHSETPSSIEAQRGKGENNLSEALNSLG
jgi:hypothetical protein